MKHHCPNCGRAIPTRTRVGRPHTYCSKGCRLAGEREVARIDQRLSHLEAKLSALRLTDQRTGWEDDPAKLEAEILLQRARLAELCER